MTDICASTVVRRGTGHAETAMAGQTVMMSLDMGRYYALDGTAQRIWEMIAEPVAVAEIVRRLTDEYDVASAACETDVLEFLASLDENGLLVREAA